MALYNCQVLHYFPYFYITMEKAAKTIKLEDLPRPESQRTLTPSEGSFTDRPQTTDEEAACQVEAKNETDASAPNDDPNAIGWDGPDDPQNPMNWPEKKKWTTIGALSLMTLLTYVLSV